MQTIRQFPSWFSKQKPSGKLFIGCSGLFVLFCLCVILVDLSPSTPMPAPTQDIAAVYTQAFETAWASLPTWAGIHDNREPSPSLTTAPAPESEKP